MNCLYAIWRMYLCRKIWLVQSCAQTNKRKWCQGSSHYRELIINSHSKTPEESLSTRKQRYKLPALLLYDFFSQVHSTDFLAECLQLIPLINLKLRNCCQQWIFLKLKKPPCMKMTICLIKTIYIIHWICTNHLLSINTQVHFDHFPN